MMNILYKASNAVLVLFGIVFLLPAFVTVVGIVAFVVCNTVFGMTAEDAHLITDSVNYVWKLYGFIE